MSLFKSEIIVTPKIYGVTDGTSAAAGQVGEYVTSSVAVGSAVALTTATPANVASISLTPGDWAVSGHINLNGTGTTTAAGGLVEGTVTVTSATLDTNGSEVYLLLPALTTTAFKASLTESVKHITITTTTTVYLVAQAAFSAGTVGAFGKISAFRIR